MLLGHHCDTSTTHTSTTRIHSPKHKCQHRRPKRVARGIRQVVRVHHTNHVLENAPPRLPRSPVPVQVLWLLQDTQVSFIGRDQLSQVAHGEDASIVLVIPPGVEDLASQISRPRRAEDDTVSEPWKPSREPLIVALEDHILLIHAHRDSSPRVQASGTPRHDSPIVGVRTPYSSPPRRATPAPIPPAPRVIRTLHQGGTPGQVRKVP